MERQLDQVEMLHLHEGGPVEAVWQWVVALHRGHFGDWWSVMSEDWRSRLAHEWVADHRRDAWMGRFDAQALPAELVDLTARFAARALFGEAQLTRYRRCWPHGFKGWGAASHPRLVALDREQVLLVDKRVAQRAQRRAYDADGRIVVPRGSGQLFDLTYAQRRWWLEEPRTRA